MFSSQNITNCLFLCSTPMIILKNNIQLFKINQFLSMNFSIKVDKQTLNILDQSKMNRRQYLSLMERKQI